MRFSVSSQRSWLSVSLIDVTELLGLISLQTGPSVVPALTATTRTKRTYAVAAIADAAFECTCSTISAAMRLVTPKRSLISGLRRQMRTVFWRVAGKSKRRHSGQRTKRHESQLALLVRLSLEPEAVLTFHDYCLSFGEDPNGSHHIPSRYLVSTALLSRLAFYSVQQPIAIRMSLRNRENRLASKQYVISVAPII